LDTDRNLLFGVVALQADLLDADQFIRACTLWTTRKEVPLADLLVELGWLTDADKSDVVRRHYGPEEKDTAILAWQLSEAG